jgi:hypothetical protein
MKWTIYYLQWPGLFSLYFQLSLAVKITTVRARACHCCSIMTLRCSSVPLQKRQLYEFLLTVGRWPNGCYRHFPVRMRVL